MNIINMKEYKINGMAIMANNMREAFDYVYCINNPIQVVVSFEDGRKMKMQVQIAYQSQFMEDSVAIAIEERLELIGMSHSHYDVYDMDGKWLSCSEL